MACIGHYCIDGVNNQPHFQGYGVSTTDSWYFLHKWWLNWSLPNLKPGKIIYGKDLTFKGGSHSSPLSIIPEKKRPKGDEGSLPRKCRKVLKTHFGKTFLLFLQSEEKCRSIIWYCWAIEPKFHLGVFLGPKAKTQNWFLTRVKQQTRITNNPLAPIWWLKRGQTTQGFAEGIINLNFKIIISRFYVQHWF